MLNQKKLNTKLINNLPLIHEEVQNVTFSVGKGFADISYTLPTGANVLLGVLNGRPSADWISADISAIGVNSCRISYNNTYSSAIAGDVKLKVLYTI